MSMWKLYKHINMPLNMKIYHSYSFKGINTYNKQHLVFLYFHLPPQKVCMQLIITIDLHIQPTLSSLPFPFHLFYLSKGLCCNTQPTQLLPLGNPSDSLPRYQPSLTFVHPQSFIDIILYVNRSIT